MPKIKIKNSSTNNLIDFIKENNITFSSEVRLEQTGLKQIIRLNVSSQKARDTLQNILQEYGNKLYHNTTFSNDLNVLNMFNYLSNDYENNVAEEGERGLPNYYVENVNEQNQNLSSLKSLNCTFITKSVIDNLGSRQQGLVVRPSSVLNRFKNIIFGNEFVFSRSKSSIDNFPYYNKIEIGTLDEQNHLSKFLHKTFFQEEMLAGFTSDNNKIDVTFYINDSSDVTTIPVMDLFEILENNSLELDQTDKLVLGTMKKNSNYLTNNFKKFVVRNFLKSKYQKDLSTFKQMVESQECRRENLAFKIQKFVDSDSEPIQTFWFHGYTQEQAREYIDYQIKKDKKYRYKLSAYCLIYGNQTSIARVDFSQLNQVVFEIDTFPSYKIAEIDYEEIQISIAPKLLMPPFVQFFNENNQENKIKIYLDLKNGSLREKFIPITSDDNIVFEDLTDDDGMINFEYQKQDGKFEIFRLSEKPTSYESFENAKILDVRNKISSTSAIFMDNVKPNKKYYYMFRSINFVGHPSNPTPIYEVELVKMASSSKVLVSVFSLTKEKSHKDKMFKSLLQIKPAFQQDIFDDQEQYVQDLPSFKKNINNLKLGTASDKVWGKKFKIRVKSKDTGKIMDLNVKFNLIKDNIK